MKSFQNKTVSVFRAAISLAGRGPHPAAIHSVMDGPGILRMASISKLSQNEVQSDRRTGQTEKTAAHRRRPLRVLFVHRDADRVDCCVQELEKAQFTVGAAVFFTLAHSP